MAIDNEKMVIMDDPVRFCDENKIHISEEQLENIKKQFDLILPNIEDEALGLLILLS